MCHRRVASMVHTLSILIAATPLRVLSLADYGKECLVLRDQHAARHLVGGPLPRGRRVSIEVSIECAPSRGAARTGKCIAAAAVATTQSVCNAIPRVLQKRLPTDFARWDAAGLAKRLPDSRAGMRLPRVWAAASQRWEAASRAWEVASGTCFASPGLSQIPRVGGVSVQSCAEIA